MEQGYCGRDCAACEVREDYGCGGCRATEGVPPHGPCPIAACCREKGLEGCGRCGALDCELLPERNGAPQTQTRLERLQLEALGGRERAAELAVGLGHLFWVWLEGELAVSLVGAVAAVLAAHSGSRLLLLVPGAVELAVCLVMGRILGRLGEEFRTVPPFLAAYGAVRVVSGVVRPLWAAGLLTLLQGVLRLVWIFRLYRANGALLDRIGDRRAALWRRLAWWAVAVGAVVYLLQVPVPRLFTDVGTLESLGLLLWLESLSAAAVVLAYVLRAVLWAVELSSSVLWVVRWVQLWWTAETFRRLGRGEPTQ